LDLKNLNPFISGTQKSAKIISKSPNRHKKCNWPKKAKELLILFGLFSKVNKAEGVERSQKLQIWPQKKQVGNTDSVCHMDQSAIKLLLYILLFAGLPVTVMVVRTWM